jgi:hypothetical protein
VQLRRAPSWEQIAAAEAKEEPPVKQLSPAVNKLSPDMTGDAFLFAASSSSS